MNTANEFEDKATRLLSRLTAVSNPNPPKTRNETPKVSLQQISRLKEELECSEIDTNKKMKTLRQTMKKLEGSLVQQGQVRTQKDETFAQAISKLQKNMKTALSNVQKSFTERQKRLSQKIEILIKTEKKDLQARIKDNDELINQMEGLDSKIAAIAEEVVALRRARVELEDRINKQFAEQLKELKKIFEADVRAREQREGKVIQALKTVYKNGMERVYIQQKERQESEKLLMSVIQQLVDHIIEV